jgi:hypothetical protein
LVENFVVVSSRENKIVFVRNEMEKYIGLYTIGYCKKEKRKKKE